MIIIIGGTVLVLKLFKTTLKKEIIGHLVSRHLDLCNLIWVRLFETVLLDLIFCCVFRTHLSLYAFYNFLEVIL